VDDIDLFTGGLRETAANLAILEWNIQFLCEENPGFGTKTNMNFILFLLDPV
jgi:hypothetical protein